MIRTLYLYLFALVGLVLIAIGGVRLVDMALRALVFTEAEAEERLQMRQPIMPPPVRVDAVRELAREEGEAGEDGARPPALSAEDRARLRDWLDAQDRWQAERAAIDPVRARRHRQAASALAFLLVGFPLYLYHWRLIRQESP